MTEVIEREANSINDQTANDGAQPVKGRLKDAAIGMLSFFHDINGASHGETISFRDLPGMEPVDSLALESFVRVQQDKEARVRYADQIEGVINELSVRGYFDEEDPSVQQGIFDDTTGRRISPEIALTKMPKLVELYKEYMDLSFKLKKLQTFDLEKRKTGLVIINVGSKGGTAKTPNSVYEGLGMAHATGEPVIIIDADESNGNADRKLDVPREYRTLFPELVSNPILTQTTVGTMAVLGQHSQTNLRLVPSHPDTRNNAGIKLEEVIYFYEEMRQKAPVIIIDGGNDPMSPNNLGGLLVADVVNFPVNVHNKDAKGSAFDNLMNIANLHPLLKEKVKNTGRLVYSGVPEKKDRSPLTKDDEIVVELYSSLIESARKRAILDGNEEYIAEPLKLLAEYGFAKYDSEADKYEIDDDKIDFVTYSELIDSDKPASVLPEDVGYRTKNDQLSHLNNLYTSTDFPTEEEKQSLIAELAGNDVRAALIAKKDVLKINQAQEYAKELSVEGMKGLVRELVRQIEATEVWEE